MARGREQDRVIIGCRYSRSTTSIDDNSCKTDMISCHYLTPDTRPGSSSPLDPKCGTRTIPTNDIVSPIRHHRYYSSFLLTHGLPPLSGALTRARPSSHIGAPFGLESTVEELIFCDATVVVLFILLALLVFFPPKVP
ncbi:hypothetical protein BJX96DRAFT_39801 [Aspergillus floccosus]